MPRKLDLTRQCLIALAALALATVAVPRATAADDNPLLKELLQRGVAFGPTLRKLRTPTLPDGLNAASQKAAIEAVIKLKPGSKPSYAAFSKNNRNTPYVLLIDDLNPPFGGADKPGHSIDLWFVVWGDLPKIMAPAFLKQQFKPDPKDRIDMIKPAELPQGITLEQIPGGTDYYTHGQFMIFSSDQRVRLEATAHAILTTNHESGVVAAIVDPRFNQNRRFPNEWLPVLRRPSGQILADAQGNARLGAPQLYTSAGGYVKITKLIQPAGALLVEYHLVYDEPQGWFGGRNLLRSKLNMKTEDDVREFRHKVKIASEKKASK